MNPKDRNCGNCWCWRNPNPEHKDGEEYGICALRPSTADDPPLEPASWCCPEHRTVEEQAAMWEARAQSVTAWLGNDVAHEEAKGREEQQIAIVKGMADRYEQALSGVAERERGDIVAWLRYVAAGARGAEAESIEDLCLRVEAGEYRATATEAKP